VRLQEAAACVGQAGQEGFSEGVEAGTRVQWAHGKRGGADDCSVWNNRGEASGGGSAMKWKQRKQSFLGDATDASFLAQGRMGRSQRAPLEFT